MSRTVWPDPSSIGHSASVSPSTLKLQFDCALQVGAVPLHDPFAWQVRVAGPERPNVAMQEYVAVDP
jgi:hypothetical protein